MIGYSVEQIKQAYEEGFKAGREVSVDKPPVMRRFGTDVTDKVRFDNNDDESLQVTKCICGAQFGSWNFVVHVYEDEPDECPMCGRKFYFKNDIRVFLVE